MSRLITACGLLATLMASPAHPAPSRIATLATAPDRITFDVQVPSLALQAVEGEDGLVAPVLEDYGPTGPVGAPGMPSRVVTVAIPPDGEVRVSAFGAEPRVQDGVLLAPVPMVYRDGREAAESYVRDPAAYAATRVGSGARARLLQTAWIRNQRVAQIAIEPADYDAVARRLTVWARIHVEVSVAPARVGPPAERHDPFEGV